VGASRESFRSAASCFQSGLQRVNFSQVFKTCEKFRLVMLFGALFLVSCSSYDKQAPSIDVFGSYFPAWLISLAAGMALTLVVDAVGGAVSIRPRGFLRFLVSVSLILIFSIAVWFWLYAR
jgi:hypothetical protein